MDSTTYKARRDRIRKAAGGGAAWIPGHDEAPRNYPDNVYPFRQNSHFLHLCGISRPGLSLLIAPSGDTLFGPPEDLDDVVWHGESEPLAAAAAGAGIEQVRDSSELPGALKDWDAGRLHFLFPYRAGKQIEAARILGCGTGDLKERASRSLAAAIYENRARKSPAEVDEIEDALRVTAAMHAASFRATRAGVTEAFVAAAAQQPALAENRGQAYNPIVTVRGEVLHNHHYHHVLEEGQLLLNDSGAESRAFYASDVTRTAPVAGRFTPDQRRIYSIVLDAQQRAVGKVGPGVTNREVHMEACLAIAEGLVEAGLMRGPCEDAVAAGAHALFFPHGIGHMLGLDVHDMEDLGDLVGYGEGVRRDSQFGLNFLRLARPLEEGFVITIEPGIYFIDALVDRFEAGGRHRDFLNFDRIRKYRGFGGIRIEDDVLCTGSGGRVLGPPIPKAASEVEEAMQRRA